MSVLQSVINKILEGLEDYEIDNKLGDVGSKVREASIRSLTKLLICIHNLNLKEITEKFLYPNIFSYLSGIIKQNVEKMNKIRLCAGESLQEFFHELRDLQTVDIPYFQELKEIYLFDIQFDENGKVKNSEWQEPAYSFKKLSKILTFQEYSFSMVNID